MDINKVLMEYDGMFGNRSLADIDRFLEDKIEEANREQDYYSLVSLLNEHMSFCRDTSQKEKGLIRCGQVISLMESLGLKGTVDYATSLINVANAYRAFGEHELSLKLFAEVEQIYNESLKPGEYNFASLYNNWSLLYQEMGYYDQAAFMLKKALKVIDKFPQAAIQQAVSRSNLATTLLRISRSKANEATAIEVAAQAGDELSRIAASKVDNGDADYKEAMTYLMEALRLFEDNGANDFHYSAALSAMADALYMKEDYAGAVDYYKRALAELEKNTGTATDSYKRVYDNYTRAKTMLDEKNRAFREEIDKDRTKQISVNADYVKESYGTDVPVANEVKTVLSDYGDGKLPFTVNNVKPQIKTQEKEDRTAFTGNNHIYNNNMERCEAFYNKYGADMIHRYFPEYENRIAVGLVGEGSDCFGYDDVISMDHDYGVGFCMWLTDEDYAKIGAELQGKYENLIASKADEFVSINPGATFENVNIMMDKRRGAMKIMDFYEELLGVRLIRENISAGNAPAAEKSPEDVFVKKKALISEQSLLIARDEDLATVTNGLVFKDELGIFTEIRERLKAYYPYKVWLVKLARTLHDFSQYAQSNYARMMARKDYVTADICVAKGMEAAMQLAYMLNRKYAPYYKWLQKGMEKLDTLKEINDLVQEIATTKLQKAAWKDVKYNPYVVNTEDRIICLFDDIARCVLEALNRMGLVEGTDIFLDSYVGGMLQQARELPGNVQEEKAEKAELGDDKMTDKVKNNDDLSDEEAKRKELVEEIVSLEWNQFDKVKNEGGRADCQDDWNTFSLMRRSQYLTWPVELLISYRNDLVNANIKGWNLIMEKYARMMKSTAPEKYDELKDKLPELNAGRIDIQEEIIKHQVAWMEEFAEKYPKMAGNARSIHTSEDTPYNTSYETYLRGELGTYSEETFILYGRFIIGLKKQDKNLAYMIMDNTAKGYGYKDVEDAESKL